MHIRHKDKIVILVIFDLIAMLVSFGIALVLGHRPPVQVGLFNYYRWGILTLLGMNIALFIIFDAYALYKAHVRFTHQILILGSALVTSALLTTFLFFFFRNAVPRGVFILFYTFSWLLISACRYVYNRVTISKIYWKVLLVGERRPCMEVASLMKDRSYLHTSVVGFLSNTPPAQPCAGLTFLGNTNMMLEYAHRENIDQIILAAEDVGKGLLADLMECMKRKISVADFKQVIESISGRVPVDYLSDTWFIEELAGSDKRYFWLGKRMFDLAASVIGICLFLPILPVLVLLIRMESPGAAFYFQQRVGRDGKLFRLWKLRTMVRDADMNNVHWTSDNDSRITRVGKILRKLHVDEVPQLWNVLLGDMSLIGPRPEAVSLVEMFKKKIPYYMERHMVTPGITGWAQINYPYGNSIEDTREKLKYDLYYIKNRSMALDALIALRTIRIVLTGKGAL